MTVATIEQIKEGLRLRLATINGLYASRNWPGNLNFPAAFPVNSDETFNEDMSGGSTMTMWVVILAAPAQASDYDMGQTLLDRYLDKTSAQSIIAALEADPDLGGLVTNVTVTGYNNYKPSWDANGAPAWGARIILRIMR